MRQYVLNISEFTTQTADIDVYSAKISLVLTASELKPISNLTFVRRKACSLEGKSRERQEK